MLTGHPDPFRQALHLPTHGIENLQDHIFLSGQGIGNMGNRTERIGYILLQLKARSSHHIISPGMGSVRLVDPDIIDHQFLRELRGSIG